MATPGGQQERTIKLFGSIIKLTASTSAAATEVSTKLADDIGSNSVTVCSPHKLLNDKPSSTCSGDNCLNGAQSLGNPSAKMRSDAKSDEDETESDGSSQEKELKKRDKNSCLNGTQSVSSESAKMGRDVNPDKDETESDGLGQEEEELKRPDKNSCLNGAHSISSPSAKIESEVKPDEDETESDGSGQEKEFKRPDKILPCPRCNSMNTKFCYFNNYKADQPRHYCRNCERYWTAGGTLRNVPLGAGGIYRNKRRPSSRQCRAMISCDGNASNGDAFDAATHQQSSPVESRDLESPVRENEKVTKPGSEVPFYKSKVPYLNPKEQNNTLDSVNKEEKSCAPDCPENMMPVNTVTNGVTHPHMQSYPAGPSLVVPRSHGSNMTSTQCSTKSAHGLENGTANKVSLPLPVMMPAPSPSAPALPIPQVPPLWSSIPGSRTQSSLRPVSDVSALPSPPPHSTTYSGNNSLKLGKHPREETLQGEENKGSSICVQPKVLRITNPEDAAKSSFLVSLGIKPDEKSIFNSSKSEVLEVEGRKTPEPPRAQQATASAVSRSQSSQERM